MKTFRVLTLLALLPAAVFATYAQNPYVPTKTGTELRYTLEDAKGKLTGYRTILVESAEQTPQGLLVTTITTNYDTDNQPMEKQPIMEYIILVTDSEVTYMKGGILPKFSLPEDTELIMEGDDVVYLNDFASGQKFPKAQMTAYIHKKKENKTKVTKLSDITLNGVAGQTESVTVPAGTFEAMTLSENMKIRAVGGLVSQESSSKKWLVHGIGQVMAQQYDKKGNVTVTAKLISITTNP